MIIFESYNLDFNNVVTVLKTNVSAFKKDGILKINRKELII